MRASIACSAILLIGFSLFPFASVQRLTAQETPSLLDLYDPEGTLHDPVSPRVKERLLRIEHAFTNRAIEEALTHTAGAYNVRFLRGRFDEYGTYHARFRQTYEGVGVMKSALLTHQPRRGRPLPTRSQLYDIPNLDPVPSLSEVTALGISELFWTDRYGGAAIAENKGLRVYPREELVYIGSGRPGPDSDALDYEWRPIKFHLVYAVDVSDAPGPTPSPPPDDVVVTDDRGDGITPPVRDPGEGERPLERLSRPPLKIYVDAHTGEIVWFRSAVDYAEGTGRGFYNGKVDLTTTFKDTLGGHYQLVDPDRADSIIYNGNDTNAGKGLNISLFLSRTKFRDANNFWGNYELRWPGDELESPESQTTAVDVMHGVQNTWDLLTNVFGRSGPSGDGEGVIGYVHVIQENEPYCDAFWNPDTEAIHFGDCTEGDTPNTRIATVGHELGHTYWDAEGLSKDSNVARGLNEGNADVLGAFVDMYDKRNRGELAFVIDHEDPRGADWRPRIINPGSYPPNSDIKASPYWFDGLDGLADGEEHVLGIPFGRAVMHLAHGAPSDESNTRWSKFFPEGFGGLGILRASRIWYHAMTYHLATETYEGARQALLDAAVDLHGPVSVEVRAVQNAFSAINVGDPITDVEPPEIQPIQVFEIDPREGIALISAHTTDDTGLREVSITVGGRSNTETLLPYLAYADLTDLDPGPKQILVRAVDNVGKTDTRSSGVILARRFNNLLKNPGFEDGKVDWTFFGDVRVEDSTARAFTGSLRLLFHGFLPGAEQTVSIPTNVESVLLSYRLRTTRPAREDDDLTVSIVSGGQTEVLATYDEDTWTEDTFRMSWQKFEHDLTAYAGKTVTLRFSGPARRGSQVYSLDHVRLTVERPRSAGDLNFQVLANDRSVALSLPNLSGIENDEIAQVIYRFGSGAEVASSFGDYDYFTIAESHTDELPAGTWLARAEVIGLDQKILAVTETVEITIPLVQELLKNRGFDTGLAPWIDGGGHVAIFDNTFLIPGFRSAKMARLGGSGMDNNSWVAQKVKIPKLLTKLVLSFRLRLERPEGVPVIDRFKVHTYDKFGDQIEALFSVFAQDTIAAQNTEPGEDGTAWRGYRYYEIELDAVTYAGKQIFLELRSQEKAPYPARWYVDNVSLTWKSFGIGG